MAVSGSADGLELERLSLLAAASRLTTKSGRGKSGDRGRNVSALASRKAACKVVSLINYEWRGLTKCGDGEAIGR